MKRMLLAAAACAALAACGTIKLDRAISGGAMGLGAGALAGPGGAVAGGLIGAGVGAVTPPSLINLGQPFWRRGTVTVGAAQPQPPLPQPTPLYGRPTISGGAGYYRATYPSGCSVQYSAQGARTGYYGTCDSNQISVADQEMYNYRLTNASAGAAPPLAGGPLPGAPATGVAVDINRMRTNCEAAADQRWGLLRGSARATAVRGDDRTGYQIDVTSAYQQARCTMALNGDVARID